MKTIHSADFWGFLRFAVVRARARGLTEAQAMRMIGRELPSAHKRNRKRVLEEARYLWRQKARNPRYRRRLPVPEQHQLRIARQTLRYTDVGARIMGGPTKAEAREIIARLTGKRARINPRYRKTKSCRHRRRNPGVPPNSWKVYASIRPGDTVYYQQYAGMGRGGPEYKEGSGRAVMLGPAGWVISKIETRHGQPDIVDETNVIRVVRRGRR